MIQIFFLLSFLLQGVRGIKQLHTRKHSGIRPGVKTSGVMNPQSGSYTIIDCARPALCTVEILQDGPFKLTGSLVHYWTERIAVAQKLFYGVKLPLLQAAMNRST